jgi:hypothetical protein
VESGPSHLLHFVQLMTQTCENSDKAPADATLERLQVTYEALLCIPLQWQLILAVPLSGGEFSHGLDPKLPFTTVANGRDEWKRELGRQPPTLEAGPGVQ